MCNAALILKDKLTIVAATREAGRIYAITENESQSKNRGYEILTSGGIDRSRATVQIHKNQPAQNLIRSKITCSVPVAVPGALKMFGGQGWGDAITIQESAVFRLES